MVYIAAKKCPNLFLVGRYEQDFLKLHVAVLIEVACHQCDADNGAAGAAERGIAAACQQESCDAVTANGFSNLL